MQGLLVCRGLRKQITKVYNAGGRGCKFSDKAFQPSEQVEERDYFTCLHLWLRYRL